ncbi:hypothetical protein FLAVO9R_120037 [Flavobacterium sp. 9R]|jgi:hypothetical protein|uniref:hypothetical protein n=1 Tax=Flavobacterium sp. 9R TaxID=2653143 RepID=UPI0012EF8E41|nr:hypothetical protein [Flavobacterium sp. 9R]VXB23081.1 hypothetical protein FLAVO9R_120037 [Flavobacterium sp. 9R]
MIDKIQLFLESFEDANDVLEGLFTVIKTVKKTIGFFRFLRSFVISKIMLKNDINQKQSAEQNSSKNKSK